MDCEHEGWAGKTVSPNGWKTGTRVFEYNLARYSMGKTIFHSWAVVLDVNGEVKSYYASNFTDFKHGGNV